MRSISCYIAYVYLQIFSEGTGHNLTTTKYKILQPTYMLYALLKFLNSILLYKKVTKITKYVVTGKVFWKGYLFLVNVNYNSELIALSFALEKCENFDKTYEGCQQINHIVFTSHFLCTRWWIDWRECKGSCSQWKVC